MPDSYRIFIIDDEPRMCESLSKLLSDRGYQVESSNTAREGLTRLSQAAYDLLLLDIVLPDMNGLEVLEFVHGRYPQLLVIMFSGFASIESAVSALKNGAFDYIRKPMEYEELIKRVDNALEQKRLIREKEAIHWALEQAQKRYKYLVENSPDIIYTLDEQGRFSFVNDAFERLLGVKREQVIGKHYSQVISANDLEKSEHVFNERRTGSRASSGVELHLRQPQTKEKNNGSGTKPEVPVEIKSQGIYDREPQDREKNFLGTYGVARDIRDRKLLEEHLQQVEKMEAVGRLAGGIAHDFNNFLAAVVGNAALAKIHTQPGEEIYTRLEEMERAALRARALTQQLITFAQGGAPVRIPGTLPDLIRDASAFVLRGSNVRCKYQFPDDLWWAEFDQGQIIQVIQNLIINADQAMSEGGVINVEAENVTVTPSYRIPLKAGRYVRIVIEDSGCGIPKEHLSKIFDPFFTTKNNGTGFGLATAYSILKNHGGYLYAESELGKGTRFFLFLPATDRKRVKKGEKTGSKLYSGKGRILVMDDDNSLRDVYARLLTHLGYAPTVVATGEEALSRYSQAKQTGTPFSAVIMDLTVPGAMGGKEAIHRLLEIDPKAVAIISSGYSNDPVMANYRDYGFKEVIGKPFTAEKLSEILWKALT
ncbi:MAG: response regulator [Spirochaetaceae bacterium]|nr:MAG: response regulator [Spirochaetaceae bacterium]